MVAVANGPGVLVAKEDKLRLRAIGARIKARREYLRLSQQQLTTKLEMLGFSISRPTLAQYELGDINISAVAIEVLAEALKTSVGYFYDEDETVDFLEDEPVEIRAAYRGAPDDFKAGIRAMILARQRAAESRETTHGRRIDDGDL